MDTALHQLVDTFEMLGDWEERYRHLIDLGRRLPALPEAERVEANQVRGCMSQVWLAAEAEAGPPARLKLRGDSDAAIVKGLIAVLFALCAELTPAEIVQADVAAAFAHLGLENHLSMNRRNGFYAMVERIKALAARTAATAPA
jgi:cysteine desulfuration protein SufE